MITQSTAIAHFKLNLPMLQKILKFYQDDLFVIFNGFDDCIIGVDEDSMCLIYSMDAILNVLVTKHGMSLEDAIEHFDFNIASMKGDKMPIISIDCFDI